MSKQIVNSNCPEFGYELLSSIPYAYTLYLKGGLKETISGFDTSGIYFFSPKHTETNCQRSWDNMKKLWDDKFPNIVIHRSQLDWDLFTPPPFKDFYKDKSIKFEKEVIVIFNRYNKEWSGPPINYLDLPTLDTLFTMLSHEYQVIYINLTKGDKYFDGAKPMDLNDGEILKKHPNVYSLYDVMGMYPELSVNEIQLRIFPNCTKYISSNGGQLILSAYFGGENIIFSKKCRELDPNVNSFYKWYHKLGGGVFQHVNNYDDLIELVKQKWVLKKPLINILVRTSGRPNYFKECVKSIYNQTYKNWNLIIGVDDKESLSYTQPSLGRDVMYDYLKFDIPPTPNSKEYGVKFLYNLYLNDLQNEVKDGYVIYLDDDDKLQDEHSLLKLTNVIKTDDDFVIWRVKFPNRLVPSDNNFGNPPVMKDISGIGFSFHIKNKEIWEPYKRGDYRVAKKLYNKIPNTIFLNEVITSLQRDVEDGMGRKDDKTSINKTDYSKSLSIIIPTFNNTIFIDECLSSIIKSVGSLDCEILVGIDNCEKTLSLIKHRVFDSRIRFFYFHHNVGPYIVKNSLVMESNSETILFFDSDDVMGETMVNEILKLQSFSDFVRPKYLNFNKTVPTTNTPIGKERLFGEGVFSIKRSIFLSMNGFEGWRTSADTEFMGRLYKNSRKSINTPTVLFYRRIHENSLTQSKQTGYGSRARSNYNSLIGNKTTFGPLSHFSTSPFYEVSVEKLKTPEVFDEIKHKRQIVSNVLDNILNKTVPPKSSIDYNSINNVIKNKGVYNPTESIKPIRENKPIDRTKINDLRKDSLLNQAREFGDIKRKKTSFLSNIFGGNNKRKGGPTF
jgi:glycosyltransferase involved in cell wall biosynthesis